MNDQFRGLYVPALHRVHKLQPPMFENMPVVQGAQTDALEVGLPVPGLQGLHAFRARLSPTCLLHMAGRRTTPLRQKRCCTFPGHKPCTMTTSCWG